MSRDRRMIQFVVLVAAAALVRTAETQIVKIGMLIDPDPNKGLRRAVQYAVDYVNANQLQINGIKIEPIYPEHSLDGDLHIVSSVFRMLQEGIVGVIGPGDSDGVALINGILSSMQIPQIAPQATDPALNNSRKFPYLLRLTPPDNLLNFALMDVFTNFNWKNCAILTSQGEQGLRWFLLHSFKEGWNILALEQHDTPPDPRELNVTEQLMNIKHSDARVIVLFTAIKYAPYIFREAYNLKLLTKGYAWILLDATGDLEFIYEQSLPAGYPLYLRGLVSIRPVSEDGSMYRMFADDWQLEGIKRRPFDSQFTDAVILFANALQDAKRDGVDLTPTTLNPALDHQSYANRWMQGPAFKRLLLQQKFDGLTRYIEFDESQNIPKDMEFGIYNIQFKNNRKLKVGSWNPIKGLEMKEKQTTWPGPSTGTMYDRPQTLLNRKFRIVTIHSPPFVIFDVETGKPKGYLIELLDEIANQLKFEYELYMVEDGNWGSKMENGEWNGLIHDVISNQADFAIADLTITKVRDEAIKFSKAYFRAGMALAMELQSDGKGLFYWLNPLANSVWITLIGLIVLCALIMCFYSKYSPMSYEISHAHTEPDEVQFTLYNCIWFTIGSALQQGPDEGSPRCLSARLIALVWWITCMLIMTLYSATLTANLTVSSMKKPIQSIEDLLTQSRYSYGTVGSTSYESMFGTSDHPSYAKIHKTIQYLPNTSEGYRKVAQENFIFIWDTPLLDYERRKRNCSFERLSNEFGFAQYALAFPRNNASMEHVAHLFDKTILDLDEKGYLKMLWQKWLDHAGSCATNQQDVQKESNRTISFHDLSGLFMMVGAIILSSFISFIGENVYFSIKDRKQRKAENMRVAVRNRWQRLMEKAQEENEEPRRSRKGGGTEDEHRLMEKAQEDEEPTRSRRGIDEEARIMSTIITGVTTDSQCTLEEFGHRLQSDLSEARSRFDKLAHAQQNEIRQKLKQAQTLQEQDSIRINTLSDENGQLRLQNDAFKAQDLQGATLALEEERKKVDPKEQWEGTPPSREYQPACHSREHQHTGQQNRQHHVHRRQQPNHV